MIFADVMSGKPQKPRSCVPEFTNAAYGVRVEATSTCGAVEREFCSTKPGSKNEGGQWTAPAEFVTLSVFCKITRWADFRLEFFNVVKQRLQLTCK